MADVIAVLNAGSSSIKFSLFILRDGEAELLARGQTEGIYTAPHFVAKDREGKVVAEKSWPEGTKLGHEGAIDHLFTHVRAEFSGHRLLGVGHRVVHGGLEYTQSVRLTSEVLTKLERLIPLVPLHQPHNLAPIRLLLERRPELPQVACFDTSFHRTNSYLTQIYALPLEYAEMGVIRYGFHGLSYEYIASVLPKFDARAASGKTVVLHLGNGASMCALENSRSMTSTMEFSSFVGLPMGTRCGALDPGVLLYLMEGRGMDLKAIEKLVYSQSGLLGVSGLSSDMRTLLESKEPRARLAIDLFLYRIRREMGSLVAALGGIDALVFTGGIGENATPIRERVCLDAAWLGVEVDAKANAGGGPCISAAGSRVAAWVIPTNEELMIARHTRRVLG
ncbi:MAG TPA: acetate/propionate family kinase [Dissulfurispiraceae bacterium]|nr:acetate/propionate family kinase [Dissulfurispiraceae bacterium]